jgi:ABC-type phosphate transport system substrate-binding protein
MKVFPWAMALVLACAAPARAQIAVVVNPRLAVSDLSLDDLRRVFGGKTTQLANTPIVVGIEAGVAEKFCTAVLGISAAALHKRWVLLAFQGEVNSTLHDLADAEATKAFLASTPGAIAFLPATAVDASVKVLRIDGVLPSDPAYKIK